MKTRHVLLPLLLVASLCAADEFQDGCKKGATEALCGDQPGCVIGALLDQSATGNNSEKAGFDECKKLALATKKQALSAEAQKALKRLKTKLAALNKEVQKDFPYVKVTADFARLELEDIYARARGGRGCIVGLAATDSSTTFEQHYANPIKTAVYNIGKDDEGRETLKTKVNEIKLAFYTHGATAAEAKLTRAGKVLIVPGIYTVDQMGFGASVQAYIEKHL